MSNDQMVCIKRPEPLSSVFEEMYLNERLVDVTLTAMDGQLQAHKLVLAASSQYFSGLFEKLANPFHYPVIVIKDMLIDDLKMIVDFMYRGQLTVSQDRLVSLMRSAENLQIAGLSNIESHNSPKQIGETNEGPAYTESYNNSRTNSQRNVRRSKKSSTSTTNQQHALFGTTTYQHSRHDSIDYQSSPLPDKLLEQSMITGDPLEDSHSSRQFNFDTTYNDLTSTRNLSNQQQLMTQPRTSTHHHVQQQISTIDQQHHSQQQIQVFSHSLIANRSSYSQGVTNRQQISHLTQQSNRHRGHLCGICRKEFREKANLKRHLQVHSTERKIYTCRECGKSYQWKDNFLRHTKSAHHTSDAPI